MRLADDSKDIEAARKVLGNVTMKDRTIMASFERSGKGMVTYLLCQHTKSEAR